MSGAEWSRINALFHETIAQPPAERDAFLDKACAGDRALRDEVASLIASHETAGEFIEQPAAMAPDATLPSTPDGVTLGHYRILGVLGEGGMGVVYLAEDTRLGRNVALKALAPRFTSDPVRRERLRREARAAAALTNTGIATVYALEEFDEHVFIAGEYVPGETLRDEMARGPLEAAQVLATGLALARALEAAHDHGIVHRDLKPENVMRTPTGDIKILDFGLARMPDPGEPRTPITGDGAVLGTPAYMSPEQIRGRAIDFRSDLFSLGVLLYELATGASPFAGSDPASTIARILETEPPRLIDRAPAPGPGSPVLTDLDRIISRCLQKSPDARYQTTRALVEDLERARAGRPSGSLTQHSSPLGQPARPDRSVWWWQFHQAAASAGYLVMVPPLWLAHTWIGPPLGVWTFLTGLVGSLLATTLRLHLWFTVRETPSELADQRARSAPWIRMGDWLFVGALVAAAALTLDPHTEGAALFVVAAVGSVVAFAIIEPATSRAALDRRR